MRKGVLFIALSLACMPSFAGNRGYLVVFIDASETGKAKSLFQTYRSDSDRRTISRCWADRRGEWIATAYVKEIPESFSLEHARAIARNESTMISEFATRLSLYRDDLVVSGFDGAFIATQAGAQWKVIGLSRDRTVRSSVIRGHLNVDALDKALCESALAFDAAFVP